MSKAKKKKKKEVITMKIKQTVLIEMEMHDYESIESAEVRLDEELSNALRGTELSYSYSDSYPVVC